ncbi:MAG: hypothetical protein P8Y78_08365 [Acidihalobacter sp.]
MAGHETMPPPVLYGLANQKEKTRQITEITSHITEISDNAAELQAYLLENATVQDAEAFRRAFMADWIERFVDRLLEHSTLEFYRGLGERLLMLHGAGGRGTSGVLM